MENIILLAPPAAGKGTQSKLLVSKYHIPHISTGDLLRNASLENNELGMKLKNILESGQLVDDNMVLELLQNRIKQNDCQNGFILDGFPRTVNQAIKYIEMMESLNKTIGNVIFLNVPKEITKNRILGRLSCSNCGEVYNEIYNKPKTIGKCDKCNGDLVKRKDDNDITFEQRYKVYEEETYPLIDFFNKRNVLFTIDSVSKEETFEKIKQIVEGTYD